MSQVLVHESGRKTIIAGDAGDVHIEVSDRDGGVDPVTKVYEITANLSSDEIKKDHMGNPQDFDINRFATKELKDTPYRS